MPKSWRAVNDQPSQAPGYDKATGEITSENWDTHPLETGDFQTEDIWICEKIGRALHAPKYGIGPMAKGPGGEDMIPHFQARVLKDLGCLP